MRKLRTCQSGYLWIGLRDPTDEEFDAVNGELEGLKQLLPDMTRLIRPGGRLAVIAFHSLEDRIVKQFLTDRSGKVHGSRHLPQAETAAATFRPVSRGVIAPSQAETDINPRARSAKLRVAERTAAPASGETVELRVPRLPASVG